MSKLKENIISFIAFLLPASIFIFAILFLLFVRRVPGYHQDDVGELVPIYDKQTLTQTIILEQSGLDTVMIFLKNARLDNRDKFIFQIENTVIPINGYNIGDGDTVKFQFPPLNLPVGSKIKVTLSAPDTKNPDTAIKAGVSSKDFYVKGELGGKFNSRDLSFQLFYQPISKKELIKQSISGFFVRL